MPQSALTNGYLDVYVNYMQGANSLNNKGTRVSYFIIHSNGNLQFNDADYKRLTGFMYTSQGGSTGWHTVQFRMDYANGVYDILVDGDEVVFGLCFLFGSGNNGLVSGNTDPQLSEHAGGDAIVGG